jgi:hypothetical protein
MDYNLLILKSTNFSDFLWFCENRKLCKSLLSRLFWSSLSISRDEYSIKIIRESGLFDEEHYLTAYSDIKISKIDPVVHYVKQGV